MKPRAVALVLTALLALTPAEAAVGTAHKPTTKPSAPGPAARKRVGVQVMPTPRPMPAGAPEPAIDLSHALPAKALAGLAPSADQLKALSAELQQDRPKLQAARQKSDALTAEARSLRHKLIDTAARIESLERSQIADAAAHAARTF